MDCNQRSCQVGRQQQEALSWHTSVDSQLTLVVCIETGYGELAYALPDSNTLCGSDWLACFGNGAITSVCTVYLEMSTDFPFNNGELRCTVRQL